MIRDMMDGAMGWMMGAMGLVWVLIILALILGVAALLKYLLSTKRSG
jgi:hypothetical protein